MYRTVRAWVSLFRQYRRWGDVYLARDDKCDGLDGARGEFVRARDLAFGCVDRASRDETHPALRVTRLMLVQRVQVIILVFKVSDIAVALPSCQEDHNVSSAGKTVQ